MAGVDPDLLDPLLEWLRIPSVSTNPPETEALRRAAEWVRDRVREAGGTCELVETPGNPLVVGRLPASQPGAPTVLAYGHYDVQDPRPLELWTTPPFEPSIRDGRLYARGAADDKGNFWPLLYTACRMAKAGELPVHVRIVCEGEEERGSANTNAWLAADPEPADACIIYDSGNFSGLRPAITLGSRGIVTAHVRVRVGERDLHSGLFGGSVPNALHELLRLLERVLPAEDGLLRDELRAGRRSAPPSERELWARLPPGEKLIEVAGARPLHPTSGERYYEQNFWEPSLDVDEIRGGSPRTVIPCEAYAYVSVRLAPGQRHEEIGAALVRLVREGAPSYADVEVELEAGCDAASFEPDDPVIVAARTAFRRASGQEPDLIRIGGTLPLLDVMARRGIPTVLTGFATALDNVHAPDESYRLEALELGAACARALLEELGRLGRG